MVKQAGRWTLVIILLACVIMPSYGQFGLLAVHHPTVTVSQTHSRPEIPRPITTHPIVRSAPHITVVVVLTAAQKHVIHLDHVEHLEHLHAEHLKHLAHLARELKDSPPCELWLSHT